FGGGLCREVVKMDRLAVGNRSARRRAAIEGDPFVEPRERPMVSHEPQDVALDEADERVICPADARSILSDRVEHGLDIRERTRDYAQDLARRSLPIERLLRLVEEAHVLDGDDSLVCKGLQELDLVV